MPPKTMSTVIGIRRLVDCDHCGKEYKKKSKDNTKRVILGCPHREMLATHMGKTGFGTKVLVMNWNFGYFSKSLR